MSVIFFSLLVSISCPIFSSSPIALVMESLVWREGLSADRPRIAGKSFAAWNSLNNHLLTLCNIMIMFYNFIFGTESLQTEGRILDCNFSTCSVSSLIGKSWVSCCWIQVRASQSKKNLIPLLIANLWKGLLLARDEEKSPINQLFSSNQGLSQGRRGRVLNQRIRRLRVLFIYIAMQISWTPGHRMTRSFLFFIPLLLCF